MSTGMIYYHGGKRGLAVGDFLIPAPPHVSDGCPVCVARASGTTLTVGAYRKWALALGDSGRKIVEALEGADDNAGIDPPSAQDAVYITTSKDYAKWYAARSCGDLYRVQPVGGVTPSSEDNFPSFTTSRARVLEIIQRKVRLRDRERRRISRLWADADARRDTSPAHPGLER